MFLIFIPGVFYKLHSPEKKKRGEKSNLAVSSHFYKVKSFLLHDAVHLFISNLHAETKGVRLWLVLSGQLVEADQGRSLLCLLK